MRKIEPGTTCDLLPAFWDILPTLCDITVAKPLPNIDGISFAPTLLNRGNQKRHEYLYWEFPSYGGQQAARMGDWKAARTGLKKKNSDTSVQLYNLKNDILKLTAQLVPVGEKDGQTLELQIQQDKNIWQTIGESKIDNMARTATFRIDD